jgi:hypothetical protein
MTTQYAPLAPPSRIYAPRHDAPRRRPWLAIGLIWAALVGGLWFGWNVEPRAPAPPSAPLLQ